MKYGVRVFANGQEMMCRAYNDREQAQGIADGMASKGYHVYRYIIEGRTAKAVKTF